MEPNQKSQPEPEVNDDGYTIDDYDTCSCGYSKLKIDACCTICEDDAMDAEDDKRR